MSRKYSITEVFHTIQGEGFHAGTPALFIRFAGCNLWDGNPEHRERDAARHGAECPRWCDTDFAPRMKLGLRELEKVVEASIKNAPLIVLTGGEPFLQVHHDLLVMLRQYALTVAVETNGTVDALGFKDVFQDALWITCSPKLPREKLKVGYVDEVKVVFPDYDPAQYAGMAKHHFVQPRAACYGPEVGKSVLVQDTMARAAEWVMQNPLWRLSIQTHKLIGLP